MITIQRESTERVFAAFTGPAPTGDTELAFMVPPSRPGTEDWETAELITSDTDPLWQQAVTATGQPGAQWFLARMIGSFADNDVVLDPNEYQVWSRTAATPTRPVRILPVALEIG